MSAKQEFSMDDIDRRNCYIYRFFGENRVDITLLGDYNRPLIVLENNIVLSCYVQNFDLIFMDDIRHGKEQFRVKLNVQPKRIEGRLKRWIDEAKHRKVYLFRSDEFYLSKVSKHLNSQFPLFSPRKCFAYYVFSRQKALNVKRELSGVHPDLNIIY